MILRAVIPGPAQSKGSKRAVVRHGKPYLVDDNESLRDWNARAIDAMQAVRPERPLDCPVGVAITVTVRRPRAHYGTGRHARRLKVSAPSLPPTGKDVDKVARAVLDCATIAGWWVDDARVYDLYIRRAYDNGSGERVEVIASGRCQ